MEDSSVAGYNIRAVVVVVVVVVVVYSLSSLCKLVVLGVSSPGRSQ